MWKSPLMQILCWVIFKEPYKSSGPESSWALANMARMITWQVTCKRSWFMHVFIRVTMDTNSRPYDGTSIAWSCAKTSQNSSPIAPNITAIVSSPPDTIPLVLKPSRCWQYQEVTQSAACLVSVRHKPVEWFMCPFVLAFKLLKESRAEIKASLSSPRYALAILVFIFKVIWWKLQLMGHFCGCELCSWAGWVKFNSSFSEKVGRWMAAVLDILSGSKSTLSRCVMAALRVSISI